MRDAVDPSPIVVDQGNSWVVLLHGLTGTPFDVAPFAHALVSAGYSVTAPRLPGHHDLQALETSTREQWYEAAASEIHRAARASATGRTLVLGFSMGSLLAFRFAAQHPDKVAGLIAISVPLELPLWKRPTIRALARLRRLPLTRAMVGIFPKVAPDVRILREARQSPSLRGFPYPTLVEFVNLQAEAEAILPQVRAPLLLIHGRFDHTAPVHLSQRVAQRVSSAHVERVVLPRSFHIVGRDLDRDMACEAIVHFARIFMPAHNQDNESHDNTSPLSH